MTNTELSEGAKLLYGEILSLSVKNKYCFATNDYFMKLNGVSKRTEAYENSGVPKRYWKESFEKMGVPVPQGVPGTNPQDMHSSDRLEKVDVDIKKL